MRTGAEQADLLTTQETAQILNYSVAWVNKLAASGRLPVVRKLTGRTGAWLFARADVESFIRDREPVAS